MSPLCLTIWVLALWSAGAAGAQPANDRFSNAQTISGLGGSVAGSTVSATNQVNEPSHAGYDATHSIWFRWTAPTPGVRVYFSTEDSDFNTVLAIYSGKLLDSLVPVASNDDASAGVRYSQTQFQARAGETYWIAIDGVADETGNTMLRWITNPFNDSFSNFKTLSEPQGTFLGDSTGATLENDEEPPVSGDVTNTVWFAWAPNDSGEVTFDTIGSEFNTILAIYKGNELDELTLVAGDDDGGGDDGTSQITFEAAAGDRYRVVIGGREGASGAYRIHWSQQVPAPLNDPFGGSERLRGFTGQSQGANFGGTEEPDEPVHGEESTRSSVWYSWEADRSGRVCFWLHETTAALILAIYEGEEITDLARVASGETGPEGQAPSACFDVVQGRRYQIAVDGKRGTTSSFRLQWTFDDLQSPHNLFANAKEMSGFNCTFVTENYYADLQPGEPLHAGDSGGKSVWFKWKAPARYRVLVETDGSNFDTLLGVYIGKDPETGLVRIASNDDVDGKTTSEVIFEAEVGETYFFAVDGSTLQDTEPPGFGMVVLTLSQATPQLVLVAPNRGRVGSQFRIGTLNFPNVVSVSIGETPCEFSLVGEEILATVPPGAITGPIMLRNEEGALRLTEEDFVVLPGTQPTLAIRSGGANTIELAWPSQYSDFQLEWNSSIDGQGAGWTVVTSPPLQVGQEWVVVHPINSPAQSLYFRLRLP
jgi:hypothetical protein